MASVVARSLPAATPHWINSASPGSTTALSPRLMLSTFRRSMSMPRTSMARQPRGTRRRPNRRTQPIDIDSHASSLTPECIRSPIRRTMQDCSAITRHDTLLLPKGSARETSAATGSRPPRARSPAGCPHRSPSRGSTSADGRATGSAEPVEMPCDFRCSASASRSLRPDDIKVVDGPAAHPARKARLTSAIPDSSSPYRAAAARAARSSRRGAAA